jgi:lysine 6-dehydrogenase
MTGKDAVVAAVPYRFGFDLARSAIRYGCHYFDFGGNPTVVKSQLELHDSAVPEGVAIVPDCGLAPGVANVLASSLVEAAPAGTVDSVQIRVGCLPQEPVGSMGYQLAFYPGGLINEYVEACEIIEAGKARVVDPLSRFEVLDWPGWGPLEAFSTAGGTSTMCQDYEGRVEDLEYKTIRYPGHGRIFAAMLELGLLDSADVDVDGRVIAPRALVEDLLAANLPSGQPDVVLVRVAVDWGTGSTVLQIEDVPDDRFSALARTTAFPATALCDLVLREEVAFTGCAAMHNVAPADALVRELQSIGLVVNRP